jgi:Nucleotide modification associated domain 2
VSVPKRTAQNTTGVYIYKMTVDDGGAPCVWNGILSLAICKPAIRSVASKGSIILGFAANSLYSNNTLVYAAKVTSRIEDGKYFILPRFQDRPDCVYKRVDGRFQWRPGARFHGPPDLKHDLGLFPSYKRANVLICEGPENFRYFAGECGFDYKDSFPLLKRLIENLGQGHRVNMPVELRREIEELVPAVFRLRSRYNRSQLPKPGCGDSFHREDDAFHVVSCQSLDHGTTLVKGRER